MATRLMIGGGKVDVGATVIDCPLKTNNSYTLHGEGGGSDDAKPKPVERTCHRELNHYCI